MSAKYLIVSGGYGNMIAIPFFNGNGIAELMAGLADASLVESKGYGTDERFLPTVGNIQMRVVDADMVTVGDPLETLKAQLAEANNAVAMRQKWLEQEREKVKALQAKIDAPSAA